MLGPDHAIHGLRPRGLASALGVLCAVAVVIASIPVRSASFSDVQSNDGDLFASDQLNAPTGFTATDGTSVAISWNATTDTYATGHRIFRSPTTGGPYTAIADVTPRTNTTYIDNSSGPGEFFYIARAFNGNWQSAPSNEDNALAWVSGTADAGGPYNINEGDTLGLDGTASTNGVEWRWDLDDDGQYDDATGATPSLSWSELRTLGLDDDGVYPIALQINSGADIAASSLIIGNTAPVLSTTGPSNAAVGTTYTLDLQAIDPGDDTITSWTINWGDGTIETLFGDPDSATHVYDRSGFTFQILAAASDEDGAYQQNELVAASYDSAEIFSFEATSGDYLQRAPSGVKPIEPIVTPTGKLLLSVETSNNVVEHHINPADLSNLGEFVPAGSGGVDEVNGVAFGPDGHLYVADHTDNRVLKFDGVTGAPLGTYVSGLNRPYDLVFGPDSALYVNLYTDDRVVRIDPDTLAKQTFVASGAGGLETPEQMVFGPDGHLYVSSLDSDEVLKFNGTTGAPLGTFVASGVGGLGQPTGLAFGPDGHLYVGDATGGAILRFNGSTGAFIDEFVTPGSGGFGSPALITFISSHRVTVS